MCEMGTPGSKLWHHSGITTAATCGCKSHGQIACRAYIWKAAEVEIVLHAYLQRIDKNQLNVISLESKGNVRDTPTRGVGKVKGLLAWRVTGDVSDGGRWYPATGLLDGGRRHRSPKARTLSCDTSSASPAPLLSPGSHAVATFLPLPLSSVVATAVFASGVGVVLL
jgi:hypothetical protein